MAETTAWWFGWCFEGLNFGDFGGFGWCLEIQQKPSAFPSQSNAPSRVFLNVILSWLLLTPLQNRQTFCGLIEWTTHFIPQNPKKVIPFRAKVACPTPSCFPHCNGQTVCLQVSMSVLSWEANGRPPKKTGLLIRWRQPVLGNSNKTGLVK